MATRKKTTKKKAAKKATKKTAKKAAAKTRRVPTVDKPYNKSQLLNEISENTGLARKEVSAVLDELSFVINRHVKKKSAGQFTMPGLFKIVTQHKPAQKAKKNVPNPFRPGELMDVKAKPARTVVKIRPLAKLKEFAQ